MNMNTADVPSCRNVLVNDAKAIACSVEKKQVDMSAMLKMTESNAQVIAAPKPHHIPVPFLVYLTNN